MQNPDLGDQLARILQSLEKVTPQVLELATRSEHTDAVLYGTLELAVLVACVLVLKRWWQWREADRKLEHNNRADHDTHAGLVVLMVGVAILGGIMLFLIPDHVSQLINARYWAIADLLQRVKP